MHVHASPFSDSKQSTDMHTAQQRHAHSNTKPGVTPGLAVKAVVTLGLAFKAVYVTGLAP